MINKQGKLFRNNVSGKVECAEYDVNQNYYAFIQDKQKEGYNQCIVTSDIMIEIMQCFLLNNRVEITSINFMVDDNELESEIQTILSSMKQNAGYWEILKNKLSFLSQNDSIEIKKVNYRLLTGNGALFSIQVNGIVTISENQYDAISNKISSIMEGCIK
ncbi:MAG: hypothetical protein MR941_08650 [[Ruminococcus] gnavus]|nr:hypothetical protein [Mediterraneibacter gnavus]